jgi:hypothetical protein
MLYANELVRRTPWPLQENLTRVESDSSVERGRVVVGASLHDDAH